MSWILRSGPPCVSVLEVVAAPPSAPVLCACVCSVHGLCARMSRVLTSSGPAPLFHPGEKVMADDEFTQDLFRFLQLLCEGHNNGEEEGRVGWKGGRVLGSVWKCFLS